MARKLPETASIALPGEGGKLYAPSADRNAPFICDLLESLVPMSGNALEIASGTGQHVVAYATRLPGLQWQPSDIETPRLASIDAHAAAAGLPNIAPAIKLDATIPGWGARNGRQSLIVLVNLLHLISESEVQAVITGAAQALKPGGKFVIYGPFMRAGDLTSDGDIAFHTSLISQDPEIGYKDDFDVMDLLQEAGLEMCDVIEMPANNLALIAQK